jgi:hypothetical protein
MSKFRFVALLLVLVVAVGTAQAATIVCGASASLAANACRMTVVFDLGPFTNFASSPLTIPQFNAAPGSALYQVDILLAASLAGELDVKNIDTRPGGISSVSMQSRVDITSPGLGTLISVVPIFSQSYNPAFAVAAGDTAYFTGTASLGNSVSLTSNTDIDPFRGSGSLSGSLNVSPSGSFTQDAFGGSMQATRAQVVTEGALTVDYYYTVPEPATMLLIGSSLLGLAFLARRRII